MSNACTKVEMWILVHLHAQQNFTTEPSKLCHIIWYEYFCPTMHYRLLTSLVLSLLWIPLLAFLSQICSICSSPVIVWSRVFQHVCVLAGGTDICYGFDWFNCISDGRSRGNGERGNHRVSHVFVGGWCFPGDVLHLAHIHLHWSVSCNSFRHRMRCVDGLDGSAIFHRFGSLSAILLSELNTWQTYEQRWYCSSNIGWFIGDVHYTTAIQGVWRILNRNRH